MLINMSRIIIFLILCISVSFEVDSQSIFVKDFGNSKQPQKFYGIENGIQLNSNLFGLVTTVSGASNNSSMGFYDSSGVSLSLGITAPSSWSGQSFPKYFKLPKGQLLMTGLSDSVGGKIKYYTEVYDSHGKNVWKTQLHSLTIAAPVGENNIIGMTDKKKSSFVQFDSLGRVDWEIPTDSLLGNYMKDTLIVSRSCGQIQNKYWIILQSFQSDSSLMVFVDSAQNIISRNLFFSNHYLKATTLQNEIILFQTLLDTTVGYSKPTGYKVESYDSKFKRLKTLSTSDGHAASIVDYKIKSNRIYILIHHFENTFSSGTRYSEVQKIDLNGKILQRNFYRFWLDRWGNVNSTIGQSTDFISLDVCDDNGYLLTGYIANGYDRRTIAIKLDSNGLGRDTIKVPVELMPLNYWDSTYTWAQPNSTQYLNNSENEIQFFPNPANHEVTIQSDRVIQEIKLYNNLGEMVKTELPSELISNVDISELQIGFYILELMSSSGSVIRKRLVINH